ncbi:MAG: GntR family transcriptional regulator [Coxiella sp. (in: Bacteria)]|nr:MAG: GntR family transcriptional regulator [Coxiella sp. (in: g-proteobacteria)]
MEWNSKQPIYLQLKEMIATRILEGAIAEETMIPSIRHMSMEYQINPLTVSKAYQELVDEDIIVKQRGLGMKVLAGAQQKLLDRERQYVIEVEWPQLQKKLKRLSINLKELFDE